MPDTFVSHVGDVLKYVKEYWHLIAAGAATLYGAALMVKQSWLRGYATKQEMHECRDSLHEEIHHNRELNTKEHNALRDLIITRLEK
mgnify:FL=1